MELVLILVLFIGIFYLFMVSIENKFIVMGGIIVGFFSLAIIIKRLIEKLVQIEFNEKHIIIEYKYPRKIEKIDYSKVIGLNHFQGSRTPTKNILRYELDNGKDQKVKFYSIALYENYIDFIKWLKKKNDKIEFKIFPPDSNLEFEYQKEFGFKYRKFLKKTL